MGVYEHLLPGKKKCINARVILSNTTPPGGYYLPAAGDTMEIRKFIRTLENRGENTLKALESARDLLKELESDDC